MPVQWLHIMTHPEVKDKSECFHKLRYVYTVSDVYDLLENLDALDAYSAERAKLEKARNKK